MHFQRDRVSMYSSPRWKPLQERKKAAASWTRVGCRAQLQCNTTSVSTDLLQVAIGIATGSYHHWCPYLRVSFCSQQMQLHFVGKAWRQECHCRVRLFLTFSLPLFLTLNTGPVLNLISPLGRLRLTAVDASQIDLVATSSARVDHGVKVETGCRWTRALECRQGRR